MMCSLVPQPSSISVMNGYCKPLKTILKSPSLDAFQKMLVNAEGAYSSSEDEDETPPQLLRAKSVGCPASPKKSVRFADTHGLALAQVYDIREPDREARCTSPHWSAKRGHLVKSLCLTCSQPASTDGFLDRVRHKCVCLENVAVRDMSVKGTVMVANLAYEKRVSVRWTVDNWGSHQDSEASYVQRGSSNGECDRFAFEITVPESVEAGQKIQFAVCYRPAGKEEYWDNNDGKNYSLECYTEWKKERRNQFRDRGVRRNSSTL